ncbi:MAG TPA: hypothetical protein PKW20_02010 [Syntrophales bacterium]|nr:hypothetical protein [Syntrophales bacterium]
MKDLDEKRGAGGGEPFVVDAFRPEDAEGIARLFRAVYGEHYPIRLFYDPAALTEANRDGRYYSIVARTGRGEVIGVTHLYPSSPYPSLYEFGVGLVLKEYRNAGVNTRLTVYLFDEFIPRRPHIEEIFGEAVCNHPYTQRAIEPFRFIETGIEVALMPAEAYAREKSAPGRVATVCGFRCFQPKPHRVYLPAAYETFLRRIYGRLDDRRDLAVSGDPLPPGRSTRAEMTVFDFAKVARIAVRESGADLGTCLDRRETEAREKGVMVFRPGATWPSPGRGRRRTSSGRRVTSSGARCRDGSTATASSCRSSFALPISRTSFCIPISQRNSWNSSGRTKARSLRKGGVRTGRARPPAARRHSYPSSASRSSSIPR